MVIAYICSLLVMVPLLYISYWMVTGKPLFINQFLLSLIILGYMFWHPQRSAIFIEQINSFSAEGMPLTYHIAPLFFQVFVFSLVIFLLGLLHKDKYYLFNLNTNKDAKALTERAVERLGITFESLEHCTKISENNHIRYPTDGLFRWKYVTIDLGELKDNVLRRQLITEIRNIIHCYRAPNSRLLGFLLLSLLLLYIYKAIGLLLEGGPYVFI